MSVRKAFAALLSALLLLTACTGRFHTDAEMAYFSFSHSGMRSDSIYTLSAEKTEQGWQAKLDLFAGSMIHVLPMTQEEANVLSGLLDTYDLWGWSGFDKADLRALDGTAFNLFIRFEGGESLSASGSNAFPKGYAEAKMAIEAFFAQIMEAKGIDNPF